MRLDTGMSVRARALTALFAIASLAVANLVACGKPKAEQCKALVGSLEKAERARSARPESDDGRKQYSDDLLAVKNEIAAVPVTDTKLVGIRDREAKTLWDFAIAERAFDKVRVPSELDAAEARLRRLQDDHHAALTELGGYCGIEVKVAEPPDAPSASADSRASIPTSAPMASASKQEAWTTFHHPTLPFEAPFFKVPEVGQRKGTDSITDAAIAMDDHRMFSAAYIVFPSPPTYDCKTFTGTRVGITEADHKCRRIRDSTTPVDDMPTLEVTLACDGSTVLQRVSCISKPAEKSLVLFDVEAVYSHDWNPDEAHRFADGAKLAPRPTPK